MQNERMAAVLRYRGPQSDAGILAALKQLLMADPAFSDCLILANGDEVRARPAVLRPERPAGTIELSVHEGTAVLEGNVPTFHQRCLAGVIAWGVRGCRVVTNQLLVAPEAGDVGPH
jgi:hypothetical protein